MGPDRQIQNLGDRPYSLSKRKNAWLLRTAIAVVRFITEYVPTDTSFLWRQVNLISLSTQTIRIQFKQRFSAPSVRLARIQYLHFFSQLHTQQFSLTLDIYTQHQKQKFIDSATFLPDLQIIQFKVNNQIYNIQQSILLFNKLFVHDLCNH